MNKQYILRPTRIHVLPEGESLFAEQSTVVQIEDEGDGELIEISQNLDQHAPQLHCIRINDEEEWNAIAAAVSDMFAEIRKWEGKDVPKNQMAEAFSQFQNSIEKAATIAGGSLAITGAGSEF